MSKSRPLNGLLALVLSTFLTIAFVATPQTTQAQLGGTGTVTTSGAGDKSRYKAFTIRSKDEPAEAGVAISDFGTRLDDGSCPFDIAQGAKDQLYIGWGVSNKSGWDVTDEEGQTPDAVMRDIREDTTLDGKTGVKDGCPAISVETTIKQNDLLDIGFTPSMMDDGDVPAEGFKQVSISPLTQCGQFYWTVASQEAMQQREKLNPATEGSGIMLADLEYMNEEIVCCHIPRESRHECVRNFLNQKAKQQHYLLKYGMAKGLPVKGMSPDQLQNIVKQETEEKNKLQQCADNARKKIDNYWKNQQIVQCVRQVKQSIKLLASGLKKDALDKSTTQVLSNISDVGHVTVGTAGGPGNVPSKTITSVAMGMKWPVRIGIIIAEIAKQLEASLGKCAGLTARYTALANFSKDGVYGFLCQNVVGLIERQLSSCVSLPRITTDLTVPRFNLITQCPFRFSMNVRINRAGITCTQNVTGRSLMVASGTGTDPLEFMNTANAVNKILGGKGCFQPGETVVPDPAGKDKPTRITANGRVENAAKTTAASRRIPGSTCGDLDVSTAPAVPKKPILAKTYMPPAPVPTGTGTGWSVSAIKDTGLDMNGYAGNTIARCDQYRLGRLVRTAYVFGNGSACTAVGEAAFLSNDKETLVSCYTETSYEPIAKSDVPESCLYRQVKVAADGAPVVAQPCMKDDLTAVDPSKISATLTPLDPATIIVSVGATGKLQDVKASAATTDGSVVPYNSTVLDLNFPDPTSALTGFGASATAANQAGDQYELSLDNRIGGCTRAFATHDSVGGNTLNERVYPKVGGTSGGISAGTNKVTYGSCTEFKEMLADLSCCDPGSQDCINGPMASLPLCACDQGDSATKVKLLPISGEAQGSITGYKAVCVDRAGQKIDGAAPTCCNARLNKGAEGCGTSPEIQPPPPTILVGKLQFRALSNSVKGGQPLFYQNLPTDTVLTAGLKRCPEEGGICEKATPATLAEKKSTPFDWLYVRPDGVKSIGTKSEQCCTTKWCNVCPGEYAGAYGLSLKFNYNQMLQVTRQPATPGGPPWPSMGVPFDIFTPKPNDSPVESVPTSPFNPNISSTDLLATKQYNAGLFRIGWPYIRVKLDKSNFNAANKSERVMVGRDAWLSIMEDIAVKTIGSDNWNKTGMEEAIDGKSFDQLWGIHNMLAWPNGSIGHVNNDPNGIDCSLPDSRCAFPNFTLNKGIADQLSEQMTQECQQRATQTMLSGSNTTIALMPNSWRMFVESAKNWDRVGWQNIEGSYGPYNNGGMFATMRQFAFINDFRQNVGIANSGTGQKAIPNVDGVLIGSGGSWFATAPYRKLNKYFSNAIGPVLTERTNCCERGGNAFTAGGNNGNDDGGPQGAGLVNGRAEVYWGNETKRDLFTLTSELSGADMGLKIKVGEDGQEIVYGGIPQMSMYPIDYLNQLKAANTPSDEDFKEIRICGEIGTQCTARDLAYLGDTSGAGNGGTGGFGNGNGFGDGNGTGDNGDCAQYTGSAKEACLAGVVFGYVPPECAHLVEAGGAALWQCILNSGTPTGQVTIPLECVGLTGQPFVLCLAKNGIGNGTVPPQCVGLEGQQLANCIAYFTGMYGYGSGGPSGDREGGIKKRDALYTGTIRNNDGTEVIGVNPGDQATLRCNASTMSIAEYTLCIAQYGGGGDPGVDPGGDPTDRIVDSTARDSSARLTGAALRSACASYQGTATYADCLANGGPRPMTGAGVGIGQTPRIGIDPGFTVTPGGTDTGTNPAVLPPVIPGANPGAVVSPGRAVAPGPVSSVGTPTTPSVLPPAPIVQPGGSGTTTTSGGTAKGALF